MSLKLRTRATLLIAVTFSALLATFLYLTFFVVRKSFEIRTVEEMRSQLQHVLESLPADATAETQQDNTTMPHRHARCRSCRSLGRSCLRQNRRTHRPDAARPAPIYRRAAGDDSGLMMFAASTLMS